MSFSLPPLESFSLVFTNNMRVLTVKMKDKKGKYSLSSSFLEDVLKLYNFLANKIDISILLWMPETQTYCKGLDWNEISGEDELYKINSLLSKINEAASILPQTIIADLSLGGEDLGAEIFLAADVRFSSLRCHLHFDHLSKGLMPAAGGIGLLSKLTSNATARNWVLGAQAVSAQELKNTGFIFDHYEDLIERDQLMNTLIERVLVQSDTARIQAKRALLEDLIFWSQKQSTFEKSLLRATYFAGDWTSYQNTNLHKKPINYARPSEVGARLRNQTELKTAQGN